MKKQVKLFVLFKKLFYFLNYLVKRNLIIGNNNLTYSNREGFANINNKLSKSNNILTNFNSERNFKSESPIIRNNNINSKKLNNNEDDFQEKVLHTENNLQDKNKKPQFIDIMNLINTNQVPISLNLLNKNFINFENSKHSTKSMKYVKGYSANTHQGTVR